MTWRCGVVGGIAAANAMAAHLNQMTLPAAQLALAEYYAGGPERQARAEEAIASGMNSLPTVRADIDPALAAALKVTADGLVDNNALAQILRGKASDGTELPGAHRDVQAFKSKDGDESKDRSRISYMDLTFSAPKSVSVAWFAASSDAERNSIVQAHRDAVENTLRYVEKEIGVAYFGRSRQGGTETAKMAWVRVDHFTSRPTQTVTRADPVTGVVDTEIYDVGNKGLLKGDPQLHSHSIIPNTMATDSGRFVAMNRDLFDGRTKEFGAVYQMLLGAELRKLGIEVALDPKTQMLTLPCIPQRVSKEFSKRTENAKEAAREMARDQGQDWDKLDADQKVAMIKGRAMVGRHGKGDDLASWEAWNAQIKAMGWSHESAVVYGPPAPAQERSARLEEAFKVTLDAFEPELDKRAVVTGFDARIAAARGLIAAGADGVEDLKAMTRAMVERGVRQGGKVTKLIYQDKGFGRSKVTTELHRDQEKELVDRMRAAAADTKRAIPSKLIETTMGRGKVDYTKDHGLKQAGIIRAVAAQGEASLFLGSAGVGKTKGILPPLVKAWEAQGRDVWATAQSWKASAEMRDAGIESFRTRALQPLLDGIAAGRTKLTEKSVVVLDELSLVGTRQLLQLVRLRDEIGFTLVMTGDERQCQSVEAGPVISLLRQAFGSEKIPELLDTIRQQSQDERRLAGMFRSGDLKTTKDALKEKRQDGSAVLVPGAYQDCVEAVAKLWCDRVKANHNDPDYTVTISAPSNADALNISRAIRTRMLDEGKVSKDGIDKAASDGAGNLYTLTLAPGDKIRLFKRTRGLFRAEDGKVKDAHLGDNGSVLTVKDVVEKGMVVQTETGKTAFLRWDRVADEATGRLKLAYGYCLTIDSSQGTTSDEHIMAMPGGSKAVQAFKAYVGASRHRVRSYIMGSRGAEMMDVAQRGPSTTQQVSEERAWDNVAKNLSKAPLKELASDMLAVVVKETARAAQTLQNVLRMQDVREVAGVALSTLREAVSWEKNMETLAELGDRLEAAMAERAPLLAKLAEATETLEAKMESGEISLAEVRMEEIYRVTTRAVGNGTMTFSDAVDSLVSAHMEIEAEGAEFDPVHQIAKVGENARDVDEIYEEAMEKLERMLDAYMDRGEESFWSGPVEADPAITLEEERRAAERSGERDTERGR